FFSVTPRPRALSGSLRPLRTLRPPVTDGRLPDPHRPTAFTCDIALAGQISPSPVRSRQSWTRLHAAGELQVGRCSFRLAFRPSPNAPRPAPNGFTGSSPMAIA